MKENDIIVITKESEIYNNTKILSVPIYEIGKIFKISTRGSNRCNTCYFGNKRYCLKLFDKNKCFYRFTEITELL